MALRCLGLLVQSGCLKSPAGDLVVVPGALAEDVAIQSDAELPVDGAGSARILPSIESTMQGNHTHEAQGISRRQHESGISADGIRGTGMSVFSLFGPTTICCEARSSWY